MTSLIQPDAPEEPRGPAPVVTPDPAPEPPPAADDAAPAEPDVFSREYVEELRRENASYRTRARDYEQAFEGYDDDTREALLTYVQLSYRAEQGDAEAAQQLQEMFGGDESDASAQSSQAPAPEPVDYRAIAREEAEAALAAREQARQQEEGIAAVRKAGEDLGYAFGSEDYILFVRGANEAANAGNEDPMAAGDAAVKAYHQAVVEQYLAAKGQQADHTAAVPNGAGAAPDLAQKPWTDEMSEKQRFAAVAASAMERLRANQ